MGEALMRKQVGDTKYKGTAWRVTKPSKKTKVFLPNEYGILKPHGILVIPRGRG